MNICVGDFVSLTTSVKSSFTFHVLRYVVKSTSNDSSQVVQMILLVLVSITAVEFLGQTCMRSPFYLNALLTPINRLL